MLSPSIFLSVHINYEVHLNDSGSLILVSLECFFPVYIVSHMSLSASIWIHIRFLRDHIESLGFPLSIWVCLTVAESHWTHFNSICIFQSRRYISICRIWVSFESILISFWTDFLWTLQRSYSGQIEQILPDHLMLSKSFLQHKSFTILNSVSIDRSVGAQLFHMIES